MHPFTTRARPAGPPDAARPRIVPALALLAACGSPAPSGQPVRPGAFHAEPTFELEGEAAARPRDILLVSLDTVGAERLGVYGGRAETPTLADLAGAGARFTQAVSHFPETCLSHWSMLTGVPPEAHGPANAQHGSALPLPTLAEIAARHGYRTGAVIGGVTLTDENCGTGRGFERYDDAFPIDEADMRRPARAVTDAAVAWMRAKDDRPTLTFVHYFDAHFPYTPPAPWDTRYDPGYTGTLDGRDKSLDPYRYGGRTPTPADLAHVQALYDGELSALDAELAPLLDAAGPDTVVLVTADHGESFSHGYWFNHRDALWDEVLRVPLLLRGPGVPAGARVDAQVGLVDVTPTLLDLAGLPRDRRMTGRSLAPLLRGEGEGRAVVRSLTDWLRPHSQRSERTPERKATVRDAQAHVYDLRTDPGELHPRAEPSLRDAVLAGHRAEIAAFDGLRVPVPRPPPPLGPGGHPRSPPPGSGDPIPREQLEALGYAEPAPASR